MPIHLQNCPNFPLTQAVVEQLWQTTRTQQGHSDDAVAVRCVSELDSAALNLRYRQKNSPTNVLTFSYGTEHDIALCLTVAKREASERSVDLVDYVALLLIHAFLHATGLDHEQSTEEAKLTAELEQQILSQCGFENIHL